MNYHVGVSCDDLLLRCQLGTLLELEVTNGTGQCKVAIDSTEVDEATSGSDTCLLACAHGKSPSKDNEVTSHQG